MRVKADGSGKAERLVSGKVTQRHDTWFSWIRQPVLSPDGKTVAMVSDAPDPTNDDVVLQFYDLTTRKSTRPDVAETAPLGHQDPAWRPDGKELLYVRNGRDGPKGAPVIYRWDVATRRATPVTGPGYLEPSYSPDGKYIAATKTSTFGNDVVILDAANGRELLRVTTDGASWAPAWSPTGDAIAFLHIDGPDRGPQAGQPRRRGPGLDRQGHRRPDRGLRPRRRVAAGLVRPGRPAAGADAATPSAAPSAGPSSSVDHGARDGRLPRAARGAVGGGRQRAVPRASTRIRARCPTGSRATSPGSKRFARLLVEAAGPYAAAVKPNLAFFEAYGSAGMAALERIRGCIPADIPVVADAKRGDIGTTAARQARRAVRRPRRRRRDRQPVPRRRGRRAAARARAIASPTSCAGPPTPARPSSRTSRRGRPRRRCARRAALPAGRASRRDAGVRAGRSAWSSGRPRPTSCARSGPSRPGWPFLVPGVGAQGGDVEPVLRDGPATAAPAAGADRVAGCWSTSRGASPARPWRRPAAIVRTTPVSGSRPPPATGPRRLPVLP